MKSVSSNTRSSSYIAIVTSGLITGVLQVVLSTSYAALVYGGNLNRYVGQGIGFALVGALIIATIIALFAALPGTVGSNQDVSVAIFSLISVSIVTTMPHDATLESTFYTVVLAISLTVSLAGICFWGLGICRLGGLVRYFPYPVVGGFLAGTGWLLFIGGFSLTLEINTWREMLQPHSLARWLPGLLFALIILSATRRYHNNVILSVMILGGICVFYGVAWQLGYSLEVLGAEGWLLGPFPEQTLWQPLTLPKLAMADWNVISGQAANIITVIAVSSTALLLNASATELETKQDVDLNKELRLAGIGNLLSCFSPGFVGFRQLSLTTLNFRMRAQSRVVGLIGAAIIALALFFGASIISYFPKIIMGGVLMYLGMNFLIEWAYETWFTLPRVDFAIIWLVLLVIATVGFMPGVAVGLVAAVIMFVVSYSRTEVVRHELTGKTYQSMVPRRSDQRKILENKGERLYILQLQGFIFFGTANRLFKRVKKRLGDINKGRADCIVLDFQRVDVLDSTGMLSFRKLKDLINVSKTHLVITAPSLKIRQQLIKGGLSSSNALIHYFTSLNAGIEWCEEQMLKQTGAQLDTSVSLAEQLSRTLSEKAGIMQLLEHLERLEIHPETAIIREGDVADDFFFIESGQVSTRVKESNDSFLHLETMKNGRVVGDIGFYLGGTRTADVITTERCVMYRLSSENLRKIEKAKPEVASILHQIMVRLLAERVTQLVKTVDALQK